MNAGMDTGQFLDPDPTRCGRMWIRPIRDPTRLASMQMSCVTLQTTFFE